MFASCGIPVGAHELCSALPQHVRASVTSFSYPCRLWFITMTLICISLIVCSLTSFCVLIFHFLIFNYHFKHFAHEKKIESVTVELDQWLRAFCALIEGRSVIPSTLWQITTGPGDPVTSSDLCRPRHACGSHTYIQTKIS